MALGFLFLSFIIMSIISIAGIVMLFTLKNQKANDIVLFLLTGYSVVIAYLNASAQPSNFTAQQIAAWGIGATALAGTMIRLVSKKQSLLSRLLVSGSVLAGIYFLYLA